MEKKVSITVILGEAPPATNTLRETKQRMREEAPTLEERIEYAIDCMACGVHKQKAIDFLRACKSKMETVKSPDSKFQTLANKVDVALSDYGHYHIAPKK